jgi:hypothetical protein
MAVLPAQCPDAHGLFRTTEYPESLCLVWALPTTKMTLKVISEDITLPSQLIRTHAPDRIPPNVLVSLVRWVFAGCRQSLLGDGPSRHYLCNPCSRVEGWRGKSVSSPRLVKRSMRFSRTTLTYTLPTKVYVTYRTGVAFTFDDSGLWT